MLKKKLYIFLALAVILFFIGLAINSLFNNNGNNNSNILNNNITIQNNSDIKISGLKIEYANSFNDTIISEILPKQKYEAELTLPKDFTEGSIKIVYTDKLGKKHEEYLSGYIEKNNKFKFYITIVSVDSNGVLTMNVR